MYNLIQEWEIQKDAKKVSAKVLPNDLGQESVISDETVKLELRYFHNYIPQ
jgi:hypothetical protein